jgi:hypothetical protein
MQLFDAADAGHESMATNALRRSLILQDNMQTTTDAAPSDRAEQAETRRDTFGGNLLHHGRIARTVEHLRSSPIFCIFCA